MSRSSSEEFQQVIAKLVAQKGCCLLFSNNLTEIPPSIAGLDNLTALQLFENKISSLPPVLRRLSRLETLDVSSNLLTCIPNYISCLKNLMTLKLHMNMISAVPPALGSLTALRNLSLGGNRIATLPNEISYLLALQHLHLWSNALTEIPPMVYGLPSLQTLILDDNKIQVIPQEARNFKSLKILSLERNNISLFPTMVLGSISTLVRLRADGNPLPTCFLPDEPHANCLPTLRHMYKRNCVIYLLICGWRKGGILQVLPQDILQRILQLVLLLTHYVNQDAMWDYDGVRSHSCQTGGEWLAGMVVNLPTVTVNFSTPLQQVTLSANLSCFDLTVGGANSLLSANQETITIHLNFTKLKCVGDTSIVERNQHGKITDSGTGTMTIDVVDTMIHFVMGLAVDPFGQCFSQLENGTCGTNLTIALLSVNGTSDLAQRVEDIILESNETYHNTEVVLEIAICDVLSLLIRGISGALDDICSYIRPYLSLQPPLALPLIPPGAMDLRESALLNSLCYVFDDLIGINGTLGTNTIFNAVSNGTGKVSLRSSRLSLHFTIFQLLEVTVGIPQIDIFGLNSWTDFDILEPIDQVSLLSNAKMNELGLNISAYLNITNLNSPDICLYSEWVGSLTMLKPELTASFQAAVFPQYGQNYTNSQCKDWNCLLRLMGSNCSLYTSLGTSIESTFLSLSVNQSSDFSELINDITSMVTSSFSHCIPALINGLASNPIIFALNDVITTNLNEATCQYLPDEKNPQDAPNMLATGISLTVAGLLSLGLLVYLIAYGFVRARAKKSSSHTQSAEEKAPLLAEEKPSPGPSLLLNPRLHITLRIGVPALLLFNIVLFISSNTSGVASVFIAFTTGGGRFISFDPLIVFTLGESVHDMWVAGVWPLALLLALFSGTWPFVKLVSALLLWITPCKILSVRNREKCLMVLDALGKWSFLDSYFMLLMMVAFQMTIIFPVHDPALYSFDTPFMIETYVEPFYGFPSFLIATVLSLCLSHLILALHRYCEDQALTRTEEAPNYICALFSAASPKAGIATKVLLIIGMELLLLTSVAFLLLGISVHSFSFEFAGAAGWLLDEIGIPTSQNYSIMSLALSLPDSSLNPNDFSVRLLQCVFLTSSVMLPILHMLTLAVMWVVPMRAKMHTAFYIFCEVLNAWGGIEVFVLALFASLLEVGQFVAFIVGGHCDTINQILVKYFDTALNGDDTCFDVVVKLQWGCWLLLLSAITYVGASVFAMQTFRKALQLASRKTLVTKVNE
ncbi:Paraquat-inducible protein A [Pelomyxa schiedti]|nr:Paraquat-inducible protein A [Pelomyxa schiedti]